MCFSLCLFPARNPVRCFRSASHRALKMNPTNAYMPSESSRPSGRSVEFGRTYVVRPKGKHQATIVWLHGLGDNGSSVSQLLESLPLPNVKWICPTAPTRPVAVFGGFPCAAWFDVGDLSEEGPDDTEGLDGSAAHVANLLSTEPAGIKLGIGGFSMGAATALYSASCFGEGKYGSGSPYGVELRAVFGLSGWLPCSRSLKGRIAGGSALPVLLCHGNCDDVVQYKYGERSAECMRSAGFQNVIFKRYEGLGHYTIAEEIKQVCDWLVDKMSLQD